MICLPLSNYPTQQLNLNQSDNPNQMADIELRRSDLQNSVLGLEGKSSARENLQPDEHHEIHLQTGEFLKSIIYGGLDGSTASIIIILSGISSGTAPDEILAIAMSALIANAISMGFADYLSAKAEIHYIQNQKNKILTEIENKLEAEKQEVVDIYSAIDQTTSKPRYSQGDAKRVSDLIANSKEALANILLLNKNRLAPIDPKMAGKCGVATFVAFLLFGVIPTIPYIVSVGIMHREDQEWIPVICLGVVQLFSLGFAKAALIGLDKMRAGVEILFFGVVAAGIGYGIGLFFEA